MNRREFVTEILPLIAAGSVTGVAGFVGGRREVPQRNARATVAVREASSYQDDLADRILRGVQEAGLQVQGQRVLLKPHLAGLTQDNFTNTHPAVLAAAYAVFQELGAARVRIGDAPPFHRDTLALATAAGYRDRIPNFDEVFVDLHGDDVVPMEGFNGAQLFVPAEAARADLVVSLAKLKTDVRHGAALSITNLFGLIPGSVYGWPQGDSFPLGSARTAAELVRFFRRGFAIVDGIVGMEGRGPVHGTAKAAGVLVMGTDLVAVDATCCRLMGLDPSGVDYLNLTADRQGVAAESRITLVGDWRERQPLQFRPAA